MPSSPARGLLLCAWLCAWSPIALAKGTTLTVAETVHARPRNGAKRTATLPPGAGVEYFVQRGAWLRIRTGESDGWVKIVEGSTRELDAKEPTGYLVQLPRGGPISTKARRGTSKLRAGAGECLMVRGISRTREWALVETGDGHIGWVLMGSARKVLTGASSSNPVGVGCEVSAQQRTALRARASRRSKRAGDVRTTDLLWVEAVSDSGRWLLVASETGARGWLRKNSVQIHGDSRLRDMPAATGQTVIAKGMVLTPSSDNIGLVSRPGTRRKRSLLRTDTTLHVMATTRRPSGEWALVETDDGRWGWVSARNVEPAPQGVAIVRGHARRAEAPPRLSNEAAPRVQFSGSIQPQVTFPTQNFTSVESNKPRYSISFRAQADRPVGDWVVSGFARFTLAHQLVPGESATRGQAYDARIRFVYPARVSTYVGAGYLLSSAKHAESQGTYVLDTVSGPLGVLGAYGKLAGPFQLGVEVQGRYPFQIDQQGVASYKPLVDVETLLSARFWKMSVFVRHNGTHTGGRTTHAYTAGTNIRF